MKTPAHGAHFSTGKLWLKRSSSSSLKSSPLPFTFTISISPPSGMSVRVHVAVAKSNGLPARLTTMRNRPRSTWLWRRSSFRSRAFRFTLSSSTWNAGLWRSPSRAPALLDALPGPLSQSLSPSDPARYPQLGLWWKPEYSDGPSL
jgi:hypothetical protein